MKQTKYTISIRKIGLSVTCFPFLNGFNGEAFLFSWNVFPAFPRNPRSVYWCIPILSTPHQLVSSKWTFNLSRNCEARKSVCPLIPEQSFFVPCPCCPVSLLMGALHLDLWSSLLPDVCRNSSSLLFWREGTCGCADLESSLWSDCKNSSLYLETHRQVVSDTEPYWVWDSYSCQKLERPIFSFWLSDFSQGPASA